MIQPMRGKQVEPTNVADRALLVHVNIQIWTARVRDKKAAVTLEKSHGAEEGLGVYIKTLVSKQALNKINATVMVARRAAKDTTLPWGDDGGRLLPAERWGAFEEEMARQQERFWEAVDEFLQGYAEHRRAQARRRMGGLYRQEDYPDPQVVRKRFKFRIDYSPFPDSSDVRVNLDQEQVQQIEDRVREQVGENVAKAMRDVFYKVHEAVETLQAQLSDEEMTVRPQTYGYLRKLAEVLPALNLTRDPRLEKAAQVLNDQIMAHDRHELQDKPRTREKAAKAAKRVVTLMNQAIQETTQRIEG